MYVYACTAPTSQCFTGEKVKSLVLRGSSLNKLNLNLLFVSEGFLMVSEGHFAGSASAADA